MNQDFPPMPFWVEGEAEQIPTDMPWEIDRSDESRE